VAEAETLKKKAPDILYGAGGAVVAGVLGSFLGTEGTVIGLALGSVATQLFTHVFKRGGTAAVKSAKVRLEHLKQVHDKGGLTDKEFEYLYRQEHRKLRQAESETPRRKMRWKVAAVTTAVVFVISAGVITGVELLARKPLSDVVTGHKGSGLTLTGGSSQPKPQPSYSPSVVPAATPSPSPTPSISVPPTPSLSPSPSPSVTQTVSPSPSPSPSPAASSPVTGVSPPVPEPGDHRTGS
jgi:hypothetical protein